MRLAHARLSAPHQEGSWLISTSDIVLVVEDEEAVRDAIVDILGGEGYRVAAAQDGREALDMPRSGMRPALILLDLRMPNLNGRQFLAALQERPELGTPPVVVITAHHDLRSQLPAVGVEGYLRKPFSVDELIEVVAAHLDLDASSALGDERS